MARIFVTITVIPLYIMYDIKIDESFFNDQVQDLINLDDVSKHITLEDSFTSQQQTLMWNEGDFLRIAPG